MSILSKLFATTFSVFEIIELSNFVIPKMEETFDFEEIGELHAIISVMKPLSLYYAEEGAQKVREACGAFGYSMLSQLDDLRSMA